MTMYAQNNMKNISQDAASANSISVSVFQFHFYVSVS